MLTPKQHKLLMFIHNYISTTGYAPSFEEMFKAMDLHSKSGIHRTLGALVERGFIRRIENRARAIEVIKLPGDLAPLNKDALGFAGIKFVLNEQVPADEVWVGHGNRLIGKITGLAS